MTDCIPVEVLMDRRRPPAAADRPPRLRPGARSSGPGRRRVHHATGDPDPPHRSAADPVLVRRRQMARGAELAQRIGYAPVRRWRWCCSSSGSRSGLNGALVTGILVAMGVGSVLLAPAIVVGYAVKAADRDDRERGLGR